MKHTNSLRDVVSDDTVTIETSDGITFSAECTERAVEAAVPETEQIRETERWHFTASNGDRIIVQIVHGLKSRPDGPDFPIHDELWNMDGKYNMGYVTEVERNT